MRNNWSTQLRDPYNDNEKGFVGYLRGFLFLIMGGSHVINNHNVGLPTHKQLNLNIFLANYFITCYSLFLERIYWERNVH